MGNFPTPQEGDLADLMLSGQAAAQVKAESIDYVTLDLTDSQLCDLELLMNGGFTPLGGFMTLADYTSVVRHMRLADGAVWPMPIVLSVSKTFADTVPEGGYLALRDPEGIMLARMRVEEIWEPDLETEAEAVYGTANPEHPGVGRLKAQQDIVCLGGAVEGLRLPSHYDFKRLRHTPAELRREFERMGWRKVTGFQTRNPLHRAHKEMTVQAATQAGSHLLLHPVVGMTKPGDIDHFTRVRCYEAIGEHYPPGLMKLSLLNLAMRMAGPREALWHALIRKNHGCSHFIVGRDHAGPGSDAQGVPFYGAYDAQELVAGFEEEIGIVMLPFAEMVFSVDRGRYFPVTEVEKDEQVLSISGSDLRRRLREGLEIPPWFSYPNVVEELRRSYPPREKQGLTLFFTGLSGAGKSTIANVLLARFLELGERPVTLLDGDIVRKKLSSELGFSKEHRDLNILRIGFVAHEITKNGGIAICAPIAPYAEIRQQVRETISARGAFIEVYVSTPLEVCEKRDRKGLYAKAREGIIKNFTGISDPYEAPQTPEITIDTSEMSPEETAEEVWLYLEREGFLT